MSLFQLGQSRSRRAVDHLLHTPDSHIRAPLPGMQHATAIVHAAPALGEQFTQYTAELEAGGSLGPTPHQRFVFVLEGAVITSGEQLEAGDYAYFPPGTEAFVGALNNASARLTVIEKPYEMLADTLLPAAFTGRHSALPGEPLLGDPDVRVQTLLPGDAAHDFAVNVLSFQPGAALGLVEVHIMEHGLLMLSGSGVYRLGESWYPVTAGDFIWMAPFCPQWFAAVGKTPARYLIYKDWNRSPL